jgi:DNA-directed RNA polymerase beta subunit
MAVAARVTVSTLCVPETGDKMSSRHGQKGVITVADSIDMPFSESGVVPDLMINPHGMPSRMTAGQLWEMLFGKMRAVHREGPEPAELTPLLRQNGRVDGRAEELREKLAELMQAAGFHPLGDEDMMDGRTGEVLAHRVFIAPTFYQRLKHLARPKMHARSTGARDPITRQPVQGRARGGGVKTGYMELDCLNSYGACSFIHDRTFESSDAYRVHVDARTGLQVPFDVRSGTFPPGTDPVQVRLPYAMRLLIHEVGAMNIVVKLKVERGV